MKTVVSSANNTMTVTSTAAAATGANVAAGVLPSVTIIPKTEVTDTNGVVSALQSFTVPSAVTGLGVGVGGGVGSDNGNAVNKRPASLDLNKSATKKLRLVTNTQLAVDSPDLQKPLNTPDLEKILLASNLLQTPQPGVVFPTKVGAVTSEQEAFGKGFEEALHSLHNSKTINNNNNNNSNNNNNNHTNTGNGNTASTTVTVTATTTTTAGMSGGSFTYTNLENNFPVAIKDEPQNAPNSPPVSPIDMESQERIKLERKRQRNRVAASKCRKRKLERISKLEERVKVLKGENVDLGMVVKSLKDHVAQLKQQVINHVESGCNVSPMYNDAALLQSK